METNQPSRAKEFFDEVNSPGKGAEFLKQLVESGISASESEFLDFKHGQNLDEGGSDLAKLWAKCLSCIANSEGGVLIFGIDAPQGKALHISLVPDITGLCERLKSLVPKITEPPVQRVEVAKYADPQGANTGFVVCYIPSSPWRPHQVRWDGQPGQFYVRAQDNCIPCSHSVLRAFFAPQFKSRLAISYDHTTRFDPTTNWTNILLRCWLKNTGPGTASELLVLFEVPSKIPFPQFDHRIWEESVSGRPGHALIARRSVHPDEKLSMFDIQIGCYRKGMESVSGIGEIFNAERLSFRFSISAKNQSPTKCEINFRQQDLNIAGEQMATPIE